MSGNVEEDAAAVAKYRSYKRQGMLLTLIGVVCLLSGLLVLVEPLSSSVILVGILTLGSGVAFWALYLPY